MTERYCPMRQICTDSWKLSQGNACPIVEAMDKGQISAPAAKLVESTVTEHVLMQRFVRGTRRKGRRG